MYEKIKKIKERERERKVMDDTQTLRLVVKMVNEKTLELVNGEVFNMTR